MVSESKLHDKFLIKYGPIPADQQGEFLELVQRFNCRLLLILSDTINANITAILLVAIIISIITIIFHVWY